MRRTPALIVGGGPAGAAAALVLARGRLEHLLIERSRATGDALCGGFLSWRTLDSLRALGIDPVALNPVDLTRLRLFAGTRMAETALPRPAKAVSRRRLDALLLERAAAEGAAIERGAPARALGDGALRLHDGASIAGDALFLATGKHELRGAARPGTARAPDPALGLRVRLGPAPKLKALIGDAIELHLFECGYAGLVLQEDGSANLCMTVRRSQLTEAGDPDALLNTLARTQPRLGERLAWRTPETAIDAIANIPYGWRARQGAAGLFRLGDQAGVIASLAGEGLGIAIASGLRAAQAYARGGREAASGFQSALARDLARPLGIAGLVRAAAESPRAARWMIGLAGGVSGLTDVVARSTRIEQPPIDNLIAAHES